VTLDVDILSQDFGILLPKETSLARPIQAARVQISDAFAREQLIVVSETDLPLAHVLNSLGHLYPTTTVVVIASSTAGHVTVEHPPLPRAAFLRTAAAVASLSRSWGWDETPDITVEFVRDGSSVTVNPVRSQDSWRVEIPESPN
jgi:hypothetical protein